MDSLIKKGLRLEYFTVGYNILEAIESIIFGYIAGSIALGGFGLDSNAKSHSGFYLLWRLNKYQKITSAEKAKIEKKTTKFVALTFFILGFYILIESIKKLYLPETGDNLVFAIAADVGLPWW